MDTLHFKELLDRYLSGTPGKEDLAALRRLLDDPVHLKELEQIMDSQLASPLNGKQQELGAVVHRIKKAIEQQIISRGVSVHRVHFLRTSWFRYAAAVVLLVGGAVVLRLAQDDKNRVQDDVAVVQNADIAPGGNRAVLTVGNKKIDLSSDKTGIAVGAAVTYTDGGEILNLVQNDGDNSSSIPLVKGGRGDYPQLLQLSTPRGGQYQAVLPDGSKVWLNAASGIRFPSKFTGSTREVQITGEAYLEIAKNSKQPFVIRANKTLVEVLGTSLNINTYEDEKVERTTLISGSVRVTKGIRETIIKPGQQAEVTEGGINVNSVDTYNMVAWKEGYFSFNNMDVPAVMRQIARWYDVDITYQKGIPDIRLGGRMQRDLTLNQVLKVLEKMEVKFRVEGNRIIVL